MKMKKITSALATLALTATTFMGSGLTVNANEYTDGTYTADIMMWQFYSPAKPSMCAGLFAQTADIEITGDDATITLYVASPIPGFEEASEEAVATGGILKDTLVYDNWSLGAGNFIQGDTYESVYEHVLTSKYFNKTSSGLFGIVAGNEYTTDTITLTIPKYLIQEGDGPLSKGEDGVTASNFVGSENTDKMIALQAYVNVVMTSTQEFFLELTDIQKEEAQDEGNKKTSMLTATVAANESTYEVVVPASIALEELSAIEDNSGNYEVEVNFTTQGNDGLIVEVATEDSGLLEESVSGYELAFANNFGTKTFAQTDTQTGTITVNASDVSSATPGDYQGTITFVIGTK